ncbi:uncharacterized protein [Cicer arietinum]|uniref:uncharacterized protein n=1 Tax=Cicer arietinum TaxID=3827 RepID=UPI003CC504CB
MDQGGDNSDEMYEGLEPDFEEMYDDLDPDFEEMYDDEEPNFDTMNERVEPVMIDLTDVFTTDMMLDTRDDLLKWARNVGRENGIVVVIFRSETATARPRIKTKLILGCERSGKYRPWKNPNLTRSTWTRKCECPFRLRGTRSSVGEGWYLHVICGLHNHEMAKKLIGHSFLGRLSQDEKNVLGDMTKNLITSGDVEVIVTDRDLALMNAVENVFPKAMNLLCLFHICKNVKAKCKMTVFPKKKQVQIIGYVEAWKNRVMHFGNTTTQRVESAHWSLKRILQDSISDICSVWKTINSIIILQRNEIITSFEKSIIQNVHRYSNRLYANLHGVVSKNAIDHIVAKYDRVTYSMIPRTIPLDAIHVWWSKLTFHVDASSKPSELSMKHKIDVIVKKFEELDVPGKISLKDKLREIVYPSTTSMCPPIANVKTKDDIIDAGDDGDCGYCAIADLLGMDENCWAFIRQQCVVELQEFMSHYEILFGGENYVRKFIHNVYVEQVASKDNWMTLPKMGYVITSKFNVVVVALSLNQSQTYFPLRSPPTTSMSEHRVIVIAFVKNLHFVQVYLKSDSPISPTSILWKKYCNKEARQWEFIYTDRMQHWLQIFPETINEVIVN